MSPKEGGDRMPEADLTETNRLLAQIATLLAYQIAGEMTVTEGAPLLGRLGLQPAEIAKVLASTPRAVNARILEAKKKDSSSK
jgi:hypothetical protein